MKLLKFNIIRSSTDGERERSLAGYLSFRNAMLSPVKRAATIATGLLRKPSPVVTTQDQSKKNVCMYNTQNEN